MPVVTGEVECSAFTPRPQLKNAHTMDGCQLVGEKLTVHLKITAELIGKDRPAHHRVVCEGDTVAHPRPGPYQMVVGVNTAADVALGDDPGVRLGLAIILLLDST